jgi:DNA-directed RNA polymerase specialized sigma24 family protein
VAGWQGFYTELATTRYPALLAYATALTGQRATAEDLLQDAFGPATAEGDPGPSPRPLHGA